jgi:hypothetical protein
MAVTHRSAVLTATASATLLGAAVVHASVVDAHFAEWWAEGVFFLVLQVVESALAFALVRRASHRLAVAALAVSVGTVELWIVSRTVGVPVGPGAGPEAVGRPDVIATVLELATALALVPLVLHRRARTRRSPALAGRVAAVTAVVLATAAVTALGVTGRGSGSGHGHGEHALGPGEYPLGAPLREPTQSQGPGFYFAARPLPRVVLELGVGPVTAGINTFDIVVVDQLGGRVDLPLMSVTATPPGRGREPLRFRASRLAPGHFVVDAAPLTTAGPWRLLVEGQRRGRVVLRHAFVVPIGT